MGITVGLSDKHTVMVDLDDMSFRKVKSLALLTMKHFNLEGFIILKSSPNNYHVVFDRPIGRWVEVLRIISWIGIMADNPNVWKWVCMQAIKGYATLRVGPKPVNPDGLKPAPRVVYRYGSQNRMVRDYLVFRRRLSKLVKRLGVYGG